jgi:hypothetical protein
MLSLEGQPYQWPACLFEMTWRDGLVGFAGALQARGSAVGMATARSGWHRASAASTDGQLCATVKLSELLCHLPDRAALMENRLRLGIRVGHRVALPL